MPAAPWPVPTHIVTIPYLDFLSLISLNNWTANSTSKLWVGGFDENVNITLFDITGRVIWTRNDQVPYSRSLNVPFNNVKSGLYILKVDSETIKKSIKVIKEWKR